MVVILGPASADTHWTNRMKILYNIHNVPIKRTVQVSMTYQGSFLNKKKENAHVSSRFCQSTLDFAAVY